MTSTPRSLRALLLAICLIGGPLWAGCRAHEQYGGYPVADSSADCLPDLAFTDAHGHALSLASLRGGAVLFDFVFTKCPGPCLTMTSQLVAVAKHVGPALGKDVHMVSITVDPEHDGPEQLLAFAKARGADLDGWSFLTGPPDQIDELMGRFALVRPHNAAGPTEHVLEFFLVGPDGHPLRQYPANQADSTSLANDMRRAAGEAAAS